MLPFDNKSEFQVIDRHARGHAARTDAAGRRRRWRRPRWKSRRSSTSRATPGPRRRTTSTAWCVTTSCARMPHLADLQVNLRREGRAVRAEPRHRQARARRDCCRIARQFGATIAGGGGAARAAGAADARGRGLRAGRRRGARDLAQPGEGHLRADARRRRRRLVRRRPAAAGRPRRRHRRRRPPPALSAAAIVVGRRGWPRPATSPACSTTVTPARTCRSSSGCRAPALNGLADLESLRLDGAALGVARRAHAPRGARRGPEHLPQEPAAGDLRHRRHGRRRPRARSTPSSR